MYVKSACDTDAILKYTGERRRISKNLVERVNVNIKENVQRIYNSSGSFVFREEINFHEAISKENGGFWGT